MGQASVRRAEPEEGAEIARLQLSTWRTAYEQLLPAEFLAGLRESELGASWSRAASSPEALVLLAKEDSNTVGFCFAGMAPVEELTRADGARPDEAQPTALIANLLVEPRWGRRGHAGRLLAAAAVELRQRGARTGIAWVPEADPSSVGFYSRAGWAVDGTVRTLDAAGLPLREIRMRGDLDLRLVH
ncbi:MAG: GNAT family N-acetyltransferase [Sciscionella sp.]